MQTKFALILLDSLWCHMLLMSSRRLFLNLHLKSTYVCTLYRYKTCTPRGMFLSEWVYWKILILKKRANLGKNQAHTHVHRQWCCKNNKDEHKNNSNNGNNANSVENAEKCSKCKQLEAIFILPWCLQLNWVLTAHINTHIHMLVCVRFEEASAWRNNRLR